MGAQQHSVLPVAQHSLHHAHPQPGMGLPSVSHLTEEREGSRASPVQAPVDGGWCRSSSSTAAPGRWLGSEHSSVIAAGIFHPEITLTPLSSAWDILRQFCLLSSPSCSGASAWGWPCSSQTDSSTVAQLLLLALMPQAPWLILPSWCAPGAA